MIAVSSLKKYKLVIFDWDGTVIDSISKIVNCIRSSAVALNIEPPSNEATKSIIGLSLDKAIAVLFPLHRAQHQALISGYKQHYQTDTTATPLFADVEKVLLALQHSGIILAVATGKGRAGLDRLLHQSELGHYFSATRSSDDASSKPSPDMLFQLLAELGISADEAVMIGDTKIDMAMAQAAGMDSIGVTMGVHNAKQLSEFNPIATVDSYQQLQQLLLPEH